MYMYIEINYNRWRIIQLSHSKNTWVNLTRKRVHWGHAQFRVKSYPEVGQISADLTNNGVTLTKLWVIFRVKLNPFRVKFDPGGFRVRYKIIIYKIYSCLSTSMTTAMHIKHYAIYMFYVW